MRITKIYISLGFSGIHKLKRVVSLSAIKPFAGCCSSIPFRFLNTTSCRPTRQLRWLRQKTGDHIRSTLLYPVQSPALLHQLAHKNGSNLYLIGSPGSGKTTVGRILADRLQRPVIDIDNDFLEPYWKMPVADKLHQVGADNFVRLEGEALLDFSCENSIVSLTGSNPMHTQAMEQVAATGTVIFLDVNNGDILERLERMKVKRIVGQEVNTPMEDILHYRQQFYEACYDLRVICEKGESAEGVADKVLGELERYRNSKSGLVSTRRNDQDERPAKRFSQVVLDGLANDGGLYVQNGCLPRFSLNQWQRLVGLPYAECALRILENWIDPDDLHPTLLKSMILSAYSRDNFDSDKVFPVVHLEGSQYLMELFHGPTASFKDGALQLMPKFFAHAAGTSQRYLILVATSGDTGSAVLDGFSKISTEAEKNNILVMVLYPDNGISPIQKAQMTATKGENITVIGVEADFDYCQSTIKKIFSDSKLGLDLWKSAKVKLSAANSINWGRLLPQVVYHAYSYLELVAQEVISVGDEVDLCIPTGNFGNILAAYYAKEMGIPFRRFICASNKNNVLTDFFQTGIYDLRSRSLQRTISPAIDILKSSNLERYLCYIGQNDGELISSLYEQLEERKYFELPQKLKEIVKKDFVADWCSEQQCSQTIKDVYKKTGYLLDPHTAVGKAVADRFYTGDIPMLIAATAHYSKFAKDILHSLGHKVSPSSNAHDLFMIMGQLGALPEVHKNLNETAQRLSLHNTVMESNVTEIVKKMMEFSNRANP